METLKNISKGVWVNYVNDIPESVIVDSLPPTYKGDFIKFQDKNAIFGRANIIDVLFILFPDSSTRNHVVDELLTNITGVHTSESPIMGVSLNEGAIMPSKKNASDIGFDLSIISIEKLENGLLFCETGVSIEFS